MIVEGEPYERQSSINSYLHHYDNRFSINVYDWVLAREQTRKPRLRKENRIQMDKADRHIHRGHSGGDYHIPGPVERINENRLPDDPWKGGLFFGYPY